MPRQQASSAFSRPNGSTTASTHPRPGAVGSVAIHRGLFYQSRRLHSALGYISPEDMDRRAVLPRQSYRGEEQCTGPGFSPRLNRLDMRGWGCGAATLRRPPPTRRPPSTAATGQITWFVLASRRSVSEHASFSYRVGRDSREDVAPHSELPGLPVVPHLAIPFKSGKSNRLVPLGAPLSDRHFHPTRVR